MFGSFIEITNVLHGTTKLSGMPGFIIYSTGCFVGVVVSSILFFKYVEEPLMALTRPKKSGAENKNPKTSLQT